MEGRRAAWPAWRLDGLVAGEDLRGLPVTRGLRLVPAALALVVALAVGAVALAGDDSRQLASYTLTEQRPASSTAEDFQFDYRNPSDPKGKPPAVTRVVTTLPRGARYDTSAPGQCKATDAELTASGAEACPPESAIGGGVVTVDTGVPGPGRIVTADVELFNNEDEFIYLNTVRGSDARTVIRAEVKKRGRITVAPMLPGTPPDGGAIDTVDITVAEISRKIDGERRNFITTPRSCRGRRSDPHWTTRVRFGYGDGVTQTVATHTPCLRPKDGS